MGSGNLRSEALGRTNTKSYLILAAITLSGLMLRIFRLGHECFWTDEGFTAAVVRQPWNQLVLTIRYEPFNTFYYLVQWFWSYFGTNEVALRSLSVCAGVFAIPAIYVFGKRLFDRHTGLIAALVLAFSPYQIWHSQDARSYALLVFVMTGVWISFLAITRVDSFKNFASFAALSTLSVYTHVFAILVIPGQWIYLLLTRCPPRMLRRFVAAAAITGLLVLFIPAFVLTAYGGQQDWIRRALAAPRRQRCSRSAGRDSRSFRKRTRVRIRVSRNRRNLLDV